MEVLVRVAHQAVLLPLGRPDHAGLVAHAPHARGSSGAVFAGQTDLSHTSVARSIASTRLVIMVVRCSSTQRAVMPTSVRPTVLECPSSLYAAHPTSPTTATDWEGVEGLHLHKGERGEWHAPCFNVVFAWLSSTTSTMTTATIEKHTPT